MLRNKVLFVGNGINLFEGINGNWSSIISNLTGSLGSIPKNIGNTIGFDYANYCSQKSEKEMKREVGDSINKNSKQIINKSNSIHKFLTSLNWDSIITTNFDFSLEYSENKKFKPCNNTNERLYSLRRYQIVNDRKIYHVHGDCLKFPSICLGFEHYLGNVEKIRYDLVRSTHTKDNNLKFQLYDVLSGKIPLPEEWYYKFFIDDIYFWAFGMDKVELDIWWLLTYRRKIEDEYPGLIKNKIVFYVDKPKNDQDAEYKDILTVLKAYDVEVVDLFAISSFEDSYKAFKKEILKIWQI